MPADADPVATLAPEHEDGPVSRRKRKQTKGSISTATYLQRLFRDTVNALREEEGSGPVQLQSGFALADVVNRMVMACIPTGLAHQEPSTPDIPAIMAHINELVSKFEYVGENTIAEQLGKDIQKVFAAIHKEVKETNDATVTVRNRAFNSIVCEMVGLPITRFTTFVKFNDTSPGKRAMSSRFYIIIASRLTLELAAAMHRYMKGQSGSQYSTRALLSMLTSPQGAHLRAFYPSTGKTLETELWETTAQAAQLKARRDKERRKQKQKQLMEDAAKEEEEGEGGEDEEEENSAQPPLKKRRAKKSTPAKSVAQKKKTSAAAAAAAAAAAESEDASDSDEDME